MDARPLIAALAAASALAGCGSTTTVTKTITVTTGARPAAPVTTSARVTTTANDPAPKPKAPPAYKRCDANIRAKRATTTCGFAENAFYAYFVGSGATTLRVYSPATGRAFTTRCTDDAGTITCRTRDGGVARFPRSAIDAYSDDQAGAFAAAHEVGDSGVADTAASSPSSSSGADDSYDQSSTYDSSGSTVDEGDDPAFCDTHDCIPNYPNGNGSTVQCADGSYSHSGGIQGACSHHGGVG